MSGAYSIFPLRLVVVFKLTTTSSRNDFEIYSVISLRLRQAVLAERTVQVWKGSASDLMAAGEQLLDRPIANSPQQVNKALERLTDRLAEEDGISHKIVLVNGGGAKKHLFCYMPEEKAPAMAVADALSNTISN